MVPEILNGYMIIILSYFFRKLFSKWKTGNSVQRKLLVKSGHRVLCAAVEEKQVKDLLMIFGFRPEYHSQNFTNKSFPSYRRCFL